MTRRIKNNVFLSYLKKIKSEKNVSYMLKQEKKDVYKS